MNAGLVNPGEFCYRNAALQLLFHSPVRFSLPRTAVGRLLFALFNQMAGRTPVDPRKFNVFVSATTPFHGEDDAASFLAFIGTLVGADIVAVVLPDVRTTSLAQALAAVTPLNRLVTVYIFRRTYTGAVNLTDVVVPTTLVIGGEPYRLIGVICHRGRTAGSGHYFTVIHDNDKWVRFDDANVTLADSLVLGPADCVTLVAYQPVPVQHHHA